MKLNIKLMIFATGSSILIPATRFQSIVMDAVAEEKPLTGAVVSVIDHNTFDNINSTYYTFQVKNRLLYNQVN